MKNLPLFIIFLVPAIILKSQHVEQSKQTSEKYRTIDDSVQINHTIELINTTMYTDAAKALPYCYEAIEGAIKIKYAAGEAVALAYTGEVLCLTGNYSKGIEMAVKAASMVRLLDRIDADIIYMKVASAYWELGDFHEAIRYTRKSFRSNNDINVWQLGVLGASYANLRMLDSALYYSQRAYEQVVTHKINWPQPFFILGQIHTDLLQYELALNFFRGGLALKTKALDSVICEVGIAKCYAKLGVRDSVFKYAHRGIEHARSNNFPRRLIEAYSLIKEQFEKQKRLDSAYFYQELMLGATDSMLAKESVQRIENLKFSEQLRELENKQAEEEMQQTRKHNLQYAGIGIALLTFVVLFFSLSNSIIVKAGFIKFFGVVALLLLFEFINLFSHPFIADFTHHSPVWMFLIMVAIAALLVPAHHRLEKWVTHQLVEKNKRIRLANAKRTIATLEGH